jgi:hypothetical protein
VFGKWLQREGFDKIDKSTRKRLLDLLDHGSEVEQWRATLTLPEKAAYNHPNTVWRRSSRTKLPSGGAVPEGGRKKPSWATQIRARVVQLEEENARMKKAGGDLITARDKPAEIAKVLRDMLGARKALLVGRELTRHEESKDGATDGEG